MRQSMTGFAAAQGAGFGLRWSWELRSVNGKGLDLRLRLPDWIDGLEPRLRAALQGRLARGSVTVSLKVAAGEETGAARLSEPMLGAVLDALAVIEERAMAAGVTLAPSTAAELLSVRGMLDGAAAGPDPADLVPVLVTEFDALVASLVAMRTAEGEATQAILMGQLEEIETLVAEAASRAEARAGEQAERLAQQLARVMETADGMDSQRVAQELALIAVKSDVTEEIDRLGAHVAAARALLAEDGPVGRKLDFLMQEFNREANTLCSKAQSTPLTQTGLALKTVIDRMREQVQNVE
ncbi:YicC/YloC family endoribonuclease [Litorisediminicola beolgyonensis]|uniref:YicC/YloC family endoribonuclease n=1 Tax=Litorisediminicola beolgyonensis TaxID=1173614 RepID=A0ABW3ZP57_9RHOB